MLNGSPVGSVLEHTKMFISKPDRDKIYDSWNKVAMRYFTWRHYTKKAEVFL